MKKVLFSTGLILLLAACNNSNESGSNSTDSANHSTHQNNSTNAYTSDTAGKAGSSMLSIMHSNMAQMKDMTSSGNADTDFAALMKVHHMGALEMAKLEVATGTNAQLKQMAQKMMTEQQKEIGELQNWLNTNQ